MENDLFFSNSDSILFSDLGHESEMLPGDFEQALFPSNNLSNGMDISGVGDSSFDDIVGNGLIDSFQGNEIFHSLGSSDYSNSPDAHDVKPKFSSFSDSLSNSTSSAVNFSLSPPLSSSIPISQNPETLNTLPNANHPPNMVPMYNVKNESQNSMILSPSTSSEVLGGLSQPLMSPVSPNVNSVNSFSMNNNGHTYTYANSPVSNTVSNSSNGDVYSSNMQQVNGSNSTSTQIPFLNHNFTQNYEMKPSTGKVSKNGVKGNGYNGIGASSPRRFTPIAPNLHQQSTIPTGRLIQHQMLPQQFQGNHPNFHMQQLNQQHMQVHPYHKHGLQQSLSHNQHTQSNQQQFHSQSQNPLQLQLQNNSFQKQSISSLQSQQSPHYQESNGFTNPPTHLHTFLETKEGFHQQQNQQSLMMMTQSNSPLTNSQYVQIQLNNQMASSSSPSPTNNTNVQQRFDTKSMQNSSPKLSPHLNSNLSPPLIIFNPDSIRKSESCGNLMATHVNGMSENMSNPHDYMKSSPKCLPKSVIMPSPSLIQRAGAAVAAENPGLMHIDSGGDGLHPLPSDMANGHVSRSSIMHRSFSSHALGQFRPLAPAPVKSESHLTGLPRILPVDGSSGLSGLPVRVQSNLNLSTMSSMNGRPLLPAVSGMRRVHSAGDIQTLNGMAMAHGMSPNGYDDSQFKIGRYTLEERRMRIHRYRQKRLERNFNKKIKYACRKTLADSRPRVRGRFAKNDDMRDEEDIGDLGVEEDELLLDDDSNDFSLMGSLLNADMNFDFKVDMEQPTTSC